MTVQITVKDNNGQLWSEYKFKDQDKKGTETTYQIKPSGNTTLDFTARDTTDCVIGHYQFPPCHPVVN
jgi:hypothetical protein